jgi:hypothetical protein
VVDNSLNSLWTEKYDASRAFVSSNRVSFSSPFSLLLVLPLPIKMLHQFNARSGSNVLEGFELYRYNPSIAAAVIFIVAFTLTTILHAYQMIRTRTWFYIPFVAGGVFELTGYVGRAISASETPNWALGPYIIQAVLLLVAPALFAASIYMELGRVVMMVDGDHYLFVRRKWMTQIFVCGDILSFLMQSSGELGDQPVLSITISLTRSRWRASGVWQKLLNPNRTECHRWWPLRPTHLLRRVCHSQRPLPHAYAKVANRKGPAAAVAEAHCRSLRWKLIDFGQKHLPRCGVPARIQGIHTES